MAAFFSQIGYKPTSEWKEENVFWDPLRYQRRAGSTAPARHAVASRDGDRPESRRRWPPPAETGPLAARLSRTAPRSSLPPNRDPREVFADWLITPEESLVRAQHRQPRLGVAAGARHHPRAGRHPATTTRRAIPNLLAYLEKELVASGYDLKHLYRLILNSQTYQFSSMPRFQAPEAEANFASYPLRRLEAEVLIDAINKITGTSDLYTSAIPEPFTYIPEDKPAMALADGSITSSFLALFGRSARATGMESERDNKPVPAQWLHMLNSSHIQRKLEQGPKLKAIFDSGRKPAEIAEELYLTILSRFPTAEEVKTAEEYGKPAAAPSRRKRRPTSRPSPSRRQWSSGATTGSTSPGR